MGRFWSALLFAVGAWVGAARCVSADDGSLDDAWFERVVRAESLLSASPVRAEFDSCRRAAVVEQIRAGAHVLGSLVVASIVADTLLDGPLATMHPPEPRRWQHKFLRATGLISAGAGLAHLVATFSGASPGTRSVLGYAGGSAAALGGVVSRLNARSPDAGDATDRMRAIDLEMDLHRSLVETERTARLLWGELRSIALDSCVTDEQAVMLARRYANALHTAAVIFDTRVSASHAIARSCGGYPGFATESRERCGALATHLEEIVALWHERGWLIERSSRNTLDYLVLADRP